MDRTRASEARNVSSILARDNVWRDIVWGEGSGAGSIPARDTRQSKLPCAFSAGQFTDIIFTCLIMFLLKQ